MATGFASIADPNVLKSESRPADVSGMTSSSPSRQRTAVTHGPEMARTSEGENSLPNITPPSLDVPETRELHYMSRLACGYSPGTFAQLRRDGGADRWLVKQIHHSQSIPEAPQVKKLGNWFPELAEAPSRKWAKNLSGEKGHWTYAEDLGSACLLRRIYSTRQVLENMVAFWSDHLHVHADHDTAWVQRRAYDETIRRHALGRFCDLLVACSLHPAMLLYLDNWKSVRGAPNENHGRELLELHTVGRAAGYTESMVKSSAKILSGYTVDVGKSWKMYYDPQLHTTGSVRVLSFRARNRHQDERDLTISYLRYLARHPATAHNIAQKLCRRFVADRPTADIVRTVATAYLASDTDIKSTLKALVNHPDFLANRGGLVRSPVEDFVATCRVLGVEVQQPTADESFARSCVWSPESTLLYQWPTPDGPPSDGAAWSSPARMLSSFHMHWNLAGGWWPRRDVTFRSPSSWLPAPTVRLDQYVDHLCRAVLGKRSESRILQAVVDATGYPATTLVNSNHAIGTWMFVRVLGVLLDSPDHMRR